MKVTYRGQSFIGELIEETESHYIIESKGDQGAYHKDVTTIEDTKKVLRELCKEMKRNPRGKTYLKLITFERCMEYGLVPVNKELYKRYTIEQLEKMLGDNNY